MKTKKNHLTMSIFENRVLSSVGQGSSTGGGNSKGTERNPYSFYEFIDLLMQKKWTGGHVTGMGYVSSNDFVQSSEDLSCDYGSVYDGNNVTRFVRRGSFDIEKYFASIFSFIGGSPLISSLSASSFYGSIYSMSSPSSNGSNNGSPNYDYIDIKKNYIQIEATPISIEVDIINNNAALYVVVYISCTDRVYRKVKIRAFVKNSNNDVDFILYSIRQLNVCKNRTIGNFAIANDGHSHPKLYLDVFIDDKNVKRVYIL